MECSYQCQHLKCLLGDLKNDQIKFQSLKKINEKYVTYRLAESWEDTEEQTLVKSWNNISDNLLHLVNSLPVNEDLIEKVIDEWMNDDEQN